MHGISVRGRDYTGIQSTEAEKCSVTKLFSCKKEAGPLQLMGLAESHEKRWSQTTVTNYGRDIYRPLSASQRSLGWTRVER